jgi:hypothetical protein
MALCYLKIVHISVKNLESQPKKKRSPRDPIGRGIREILTNLYGKGFIAAHSFRGQRNRPAIGERRQREVRAVTGNMLKCL